MATELWNDPAARALVEAQVERAVAPYAGVLSTEKLNAMRAHLVETLFVHPTVSQMVARLVPPPTVAASGDDRPEDKVSDKHGDKVG